MNTPTSRGHALRGSQAPSQLFINSHCITWPTAPTVQQLVDEQPRYARVFEKWGLAYCCGDGGKTVAQACAARGIQPQVIEFELRQLNQDAPGDGCAGPEFGWLEVPISALIDHILHEHHDYLWAELPRLSYLINVMATKHGALQPQLWELEALFEEFKTVLEAHLRKEADTLLPLLRRLDAPASQTHGEDVDGLVDMCCLIEHGIFCLLEKEHAFLYAALAQMRAGTDNFTAPATACNTYRVILSSLAELATQLQQQQHEETDILFPRAVLMAQAQRLQQVLAPGERDCAA